MFIGAAREQWPFDFSHTTDLFFPYFFKFLVIIEGSKNELLNIISTKSVAFVLNKHLDIPEELNIFKPDFKNGILKLTYDKNKTNIKNIIDLLSKNKIDFKEINTSEGDLEDVFIKVVNNDIPH